MDEPLLLGGLGPGQLLIVAGVIIGFLFGSLAQRTRFCLSQSLLRSSTGRRAAAGSWSMALAVSALCTQAMIYWGIVSFKSSTLLVADVPVVAILFGGLMFGAGMVLTRGCISRATVLIGEGNLRSLFVVLVFAVFAHAAFKGLLMPFADAVSSLSLSMGAWTGFMDLPGGTILGAAFIVLALAIALRSGADMKTLIMSAGIGLLVPLSWFSTSLILFDEFDPKALNSLGFALPIAEVLYWVIASSTSGVNFGIALMGGVVVGSLVMALTHDEFKLKSFENPAQTGQYLLGAFLMGLGGVLAGGCSIAVALTGLSAFSFSALLSALSIIAGAMLTDSYIVPMVMRWKKGRFP